MFNIRELKVLQESVLTRLLYIKDTPEVKKELNDLYLKITQLGERIIQP